MKRYAVDPVPYPRQTGRSRFNPEHRPRIERFHAFRDALRILRFDVSDTPHLVIDVPVPKSGKSRIGKPHQQTPDADNYLKACLDSLVRNDCTIWDVRITKRWAKQGAIWVGDLHEKE